MRRLLREIHHDPQAVCAAVERWLAGHPALRTIAVFRALPGEVDLAEITARHGDRRWVYPRVAGDDLVFHVVGNPAADLSPGTMGIREPSPDLPRVEVDGIDAFLCPGLAFDARGGRLGRGRGYYDRMLVRARPDALKMGVCFPQQLVPDTFSQAHDIPMDGILTG
jgi:5-formyltetrahydrofolate cyclo-ligase